MKKCGDGVFTTCSTRVHRQTDAQAALAREATALRAVKIRD